MNFAMERPSPAHAAPDRRPGLAACVLLMMLVTVAAPVRASHESGHVEESSAQGTSAGRFDPLQILRQIGLAPGERGSDDAFLRPDDAFVLGVTSVTGDAVTLGWDIAGGYYLYRERFRFVPQTTADGITLGEPELPRGEVKEDSYFGVQEVYRGRVDARLPVTSTRGESRELRLEVTYQGCADAGLCYPPISRTLTLSIPPDQGVPTSANPPIAQESAAIADPARDAPEQDRLARTLATASTGLALLVFFGLGLLLSFTPCMLPMIPILSGIIVGQGARLSTGRAFALSLTYVLAMSVTYTAAGVTAGLSGANLQAAFQSPWLLGAFVALFVVLALAMFGLYTLQLPVALQQRLVTLSRRQRGGSYVGVGVMGFLSALIVGPCVAAPLAGALIYIARSGDALLGGAALFALSLGMGVPVLAIGTSAGRLIPRAGPWMTAVTSGFGIILLGVAIYLLERLAPGWLTLALWAALSIGSGVCLAIRTRAAPRGWSWLGKAIGIAGVAYGVVLLVGAAGGGGDPQHPLAGLRATGPDDASPLRFTPVNDLAQLDAALRHARRDGRPVMLDYYADWCVSCKELERDTFSDPAVRRVLGQAMLLRTDVTENDVDDQALLTRFGLFGPPAILFFGPDGRERARYRVVGFMEAEAFRIQAERGLRNTGPDGRRGGT